VESKQSSDIPDELIDEIVEEILSKGLFKKAEVKSTIEPKPKSLPVDNVAKLHTKIEVLEDRLDEYISGYKITATEIERQITEKSEELTKEQEKQLTRLQGQIEDLRASMIRLSNEFKRFKESLSFQR